MIPIFDQCGNVTNLIAAVSASGMAPELIAFVNARLAQIDGSMTAHVQVHDEEVEYLGVVSQRSVIEVAMIPAPV